MGLVVRHRPYFGIAIQTFVDYDSEGAESAKSRRVASGVAFESVQVFLAGEFPFDVLPDQGEFINPYNGIAFMIRDGIIAVKNESHFVLVP